VIEQLDLFEKNRILEPEQATRKVASLQELQEMVARGCSSEQLYTARGYDIWGKEYPPR